MACRFCAWNWPKGRMRNTWNASGGMPTVDTLIKLLNPMKGARVRARKPGTAM